VAPVTMGDDPSSSQWRRLSRRRRGARGEAPGTLRGGAADWRPRGGECPPPAAGAGYASSKGVEGGERAGARALRRCPVLAQRATAAAEEESALWGERLAVAAAAESRAERPTKAVGSMLKPGVPGVRHGERMGATARKGREGVRMHWNAPLRPRGTRAAPGPARHPMPAVEGRGGRGSGRSGGERNRPGRVPPARGAGPIPRREVRVETRVPVRAAAEVSVDVRPRGRTVQVLCLPP